MRGGRRDAGRNEGAAGVDGDVQLLRDGKSGGHMGEGLRRVQAGEVAGGGGVPGEERVPVPGVPCGAENVPGKGDGGDTDEGDHGEYIGGVGHGVGRAEGKARSLHIHEDGGRASDEVPRTQSSLMETTPPNVIGLWVSLLYRVFYLIYRLLGLLFIRK
ncbi:hypothetical protein MUK42_06673 [Musa troglodytarum]|uniref:Uncharacterized protein n=2 Tax=Musa troglodytarum TaxID=320322 RepID=A0A9E7EVF8_9LILI|nr:hypothetical protein MUK42_06673 [Musa troglodytarum]